MKFVYTCIALLSLLPSMNERNMILELKALRQLLHYKLL